GAPTPRAAHGSFLSRAGPSPRSEPFRLRGPDAPRRSRLFSFSRGPLAPLRAVSLAGPRRPAPLTALFFLARAPRPAPSRFACGAPTPRAAHGSFLSRGGPSPRS